ncbi:MAG: helix-turn-helix domain-containing protein [Acholeplasmatales bacterium]|nr:helix-turn-helix domain-containing protein [Acholeplasmatales bacterium]
MNRLRELRKERGLTLVELSEKINMNKSSIARFETEASTMDAIDLETFSKFFGVSTDYILGKSNSRIVPKESTKDLTDAKLALYNQLGELTEEQAKDALKYIEFIKSKK